MKVSASELRANIYRLLDRALDAGEVIEVERRGRLIKIQAVPEKGKLASLAAHPDYIAASDDELIHIDWSSEWKP